MNAYILVGGRSQRMGVSKAALFLEQVVRAALPVFDEVVAVQRSGAAPTSIRTIFEAPHDREGAVFGIITALRDAPASCFVLAVDYPLIRTDVLRYLRDRRGVPVWNGRAQPLCAVWDAGLLSVLEARVNAGILDLHTLGRQEMIPETEMRARFSGEPLLNVNTREELEQAEALDGKRFLTPG